MGNGTPIARVRGLGAAHAGAGNWLFERLSGAATLVAWAFFLVSLLLLPGLDYASVHEWLARPVPATVMILLVLGTFWHTKLGLQVVVEDYVHEHANRIACLVLLNAAAWGGAAFGVLSILRVALGGA